MCNWPENNFEIPNKVEVYMKNITTKENKGQNHFTLM